MTDTRIIKKYPNRRLYDTRDSRYISLNDICRLVMDHQDFEVVDQKTGDSLTCGILLQVMVEQVHSGQTNISRELLARIICAYNANLPEALRRYLNESLSLLLRQHQKINELLREDMGADPVAALAELVQENLTNWVELNKDLLRAVADGDAASISEGSEPRTERQA